MDTLELVKANLKTHDIHFYESPERQEVMAMFTIVGRRIEVQVCAEEHGDFLIIRAGHLFNCPPAHARFKEVAEVLLAANHQYRFVKVSLDPSDGEVIVSGEAWVRDGSLNDQSFESMFHSVLSVAKSVIESVDRALAGSDTSKFEC